MVVVVGVGARAARVAGPGRLRPGRPRRRAAAAAHPLAQVGINRLTALKTRAVAAGEVRQVQQADGMVAMKAWLTGHCRLVRAGRRPSWSGTGAGWPAAARWPPPTPPAR